MTQDNMTVDGFAFASQEDAKLAKAELVRIQQLESKMDHNNPHLINAVYEKAITNNLFKTPVGLHYLKTLQDEITKSPLIQTSAKDIPVSNLITEKVVSKEVRKEIKKTSDRKEIITRNFSIILNIILIIAIAFMFLIATTSDNPNIINYENNLQNKYAEWNEELNQREQIIREKEIELRIFGENE